MDTYEAIISKRDIRHYKDEPIADDVMHRVLQATRMAGSAKNMEANRIVVVQDQAIKDALTTAGDFASWINTAPVIIGFATPDEFTRMFDVGRQAQNLMVQANAEGLATCPVTLHHQDIARAAIGFPEDWEMVMVVTMGWPLDEVPDSPLKRKRVALDELTVHDRWS